MPIASIFNYIGVIVLVVLVLILVVSNIHVVQQSGVVPCKCSRKIPKNLLN